MHVRHAELSRQFSQLDEPLLIDFRQDPARKGPELTVLSIDDAGLFSRIAGAVAGHGLNIAGARITTCSDGSVLDVFMLQTAGNEMVADAGLLARLRASPARGDRYIAPASGPARETAESSRKGASLAGAVAGHPVQQDQFDTYGCRGEWT